MPPENTNSLLVSVGGDAVIFDAWGRVDDWARALASRRLTLRAIYSTHGHADHVSAAVELAQKYEVPWYLHAADFNMPDWSNPLLDFFGMPRVDVNLRHPTELMLGHAEILPGVHMDIIAAPGHSAGGVMFYFPEFKILMSGDTIFHDSVGRYDFPGGDANILRQSIARLCDMNLSDDTYIVHGHGPDSTIGSLKQTNPYFK